MERYLEGKTDRKKELSGEPTKGSTDRRRDRQKVGQSEGGTDRRMDRQKDGQTEGRIGCCKEGNQKAGQTERKTDR